MLNVRLTTKFRTLFHKYSTECVSQPSSSNNGTTQKNATSFVDHMKTNYADQLKQLDVQVEKLNEKRLECSKKNRNHRFLKNLQARLLNTTNAELLSVGSMVTKFVDKESDFDFVFFPKNEQTRKLFQKDFSQNPSFKENFMTIFSKLIARESEILGEPVDTIIELPRLRVPLLIVKFQSGVSIDIQFPDENFHAVRNTHLIRSYTMCDHRFTLLFLWLRAMSDKLEIRHSKYGLLSSYHLLLLCVHFLQSEQALSPWPVLPVLAKTHSNLVSPTTPIEIIAQSIKEVPQLIDFKSHNKMQISELIVRFVEYYCRFNPNKEAIYIGKGLALQRKQAFGETRLQLIDPFSPLSVCKSPLASSAFFSAVHFLRAKFKQGELLDTVPDWPEVDEFKRDTNFASWRVHMNDKHDF